MGKFSKANAAMLLVRYFKLSKLIRRLYPIAIRVEFGQSNSDRIQDLGTLLRPTVGISHPVKRFGHTNDGGYFLIDDFARVERVLSFGIGNDNSFDVAIANFVPSIEMYDHSISSLPMPVSNGIFHKLGIAPDISDGFTSLKEILHRYPEHRNVILKIDIEGAEWGVLGSLSSEDLLRFSQIVGEFHDFFRFVNDEAFRREVFSVLKKLLETHHIYLVHPNNWARHEIIAGIHIADVLEVNFVRKDYPHITKLEVAGQSRVDSRNNPNSDEIRLNFY